MMKRRTVCPSFFCWVVQLPSSAKDAGGKKKDRADQLKDPLDYDSQQPEREQYQPDDRAEEQQD